MAFSKSKGLVSIAIGYSGEFPQLKRSTKIKS